MIIQNDNDLDLQSIALLMKENNIDYILKKDEIIANSNSIENRISCDVRTIKLVTTIPKPIRITLFLIGFLISLPILKLLVKNLEPQYKEYIIGIPFALAVITSLFALPIYRLLKPNVLIERNKIKEIILNNNINNLK
jgi:hypothetical protein